MSAPNLWPVHPQPAQGEALSSWLTRLAQVYGLSLRELLRHNLGPASIDVGDRHAGGLDLDPPAAVLAAVHERTGVPPGQLRRMTIAGWVPWLLDTLEASDDPAAFTTYVQQDSVLLAPGQAVTRHLPRWRPWLPKEPMHRACPVCVTEPGRGFTLMSQIPLMSSCPEHGCRLEPTFGTLGTFIAWQQDAGVQPTQANAPLVSMDRRTQEALSMGVVTLPRRSVHVGVWFRLLRTLLDELNTPTSLLRVGARRTLHQIWRTPPDRRPSAARRADPVAPLRSS